MADQAGWNSGYSSGNYEYVIARNYTGYWRFDTRVAASSTTTSFQSYRLSDNALAWTGNWQCGNVGGWGINCYNMLSGNPQGGAGCNINMGYQSNAGWHHFYMGETNTDTYLYVCNGPQHSSSYNMNHRWWFRERTVRQTIRDYSGNKYTAIPFNTTMVDGYYDRARSFNGTTSFITMPTLLWQPTAFSVEWWMYPKTRTDNNQVIAAINNGGWGGFRFQTTSNGSVYVGTDTSTYFTPTDIPANTVLLNQWQNFSYTFDGTYARFYKNGVLVSGPKRQNVSSIAWGGFRIGQENSTNTINGYVDEMRISNIARSQEEVAEGYRSALNHRISRTIPSVDLSG